MLNLIDEFSRECLTVRIDRKLRSTHLIDVLSDLIMPREACPTACDPTMAVGTVAPVGPRKPRTEFVAKAVRDGISAVGTKTADIEPGSPWENGYGESFNAKLRDELLNVEILYSLAEARIVIESWRRHYNTRRPHSSLGYRPPAPEVMAWPASPSGAASPAMPAVAPRRVMHQD